LTRLADQGRWCDAGLNERIADSSGGRHLHSAAGLKLPIKLPVAIKLATGPAAASNASAPEATAALRIPGLALFKAPQGLHEAAKAISSTQQQASEHDSGSSLESRAVSVGFAANGGKTFARAVAHALQPATGGQVAAVANATAVANHASRTVAHSKSDASNMVQQGVAVAESTAEALSDHGSTAKADAASRSMGLGGDATSAGATIRSAATHGSRSDVAGTAVSSAGGHGSTAHVTANATGAAKQHGTTSTRADSITVAVDGSSATGSATSTASSEKRGTALSQSLMESFSVFNHSQTDANSVAAAHGSKGGISWSRDKAVGIGLWSSKAGTNTTTQVVSTKLGLAIVTSVVRSITAQGRLACADAIRRAAAELATGPQFNINDVTLHLGGKAPQKCLMSYKDLAVEALLKVQPAPPEQPLDVQRFEQIRADIRAGMAPGIKAAEGKVHGWLHQLGKNHS